MISVAKPEGRPQPRSRWLHIDLVGVVVGLVFAGLSTTPSLLPRAPLDQGLITGLSFGIGYLIGAVIALVWRRWLPTLSPRATRLVWFVVLVGAAIAAIPVLAAYQRTQDELHLRVGAATLTVSDIAMAAGIALATAVVLLVLGKVVVALHAVLTRLATRPWQRVAGSRAQVAASVTAAALTVLGVVVIAWVAVVGLGMYSQSSYDAYNASIDPNVAEPSSESRSAGPDSALSWDRAGHEGRHILGTGPSAQDIERVTQQPAKQPIRVYVGLDEPGDWEAHAATAVSELERMHAEDRDVLVVAATTGTGWLDPQAIDAVEYLNHGDTALVAMQYSVTESWHSVLFHGTAFRDSTRALITAVHDWWSSLPPGGRPRLYLYGLSLGSRAIQESFADADAMRASGDGVVVAGTPNGTAINTDLTARRDAGSPVVVPVLDGGRRYRWFADGLDVQEAAGQWESPRVAFLQHGTDPIVWIGASMLWSRPEWLEPGQRSVAIHPDMQWYPVVSGIQAIFDIAEDLSGPDGVGHRYGSTTLEAWIAVAGDGGLAPDVVDAIRQVVIGTDLPAGDDA